MTNKKNIEGNCALCGEFKKLSFEHVPPAAAFNNKPIFVQNHEHLTDQSSYVYGKKMNSNKGLGGYTLCQTCNNTTGDWYARDFADFARQGMQIIRQTQGQNFITGIYKIKPLNVIKQILVMFMSADKSGYLQSQRDLVEFLLNKESIGVPERYGIHLYSNLSAKKRMIGYTTVRNSKLGFQKWSEINFQPFGYLLTDDSKPAHAHMLNITNFGNTNYGQELSVGISTAYLNVESEWIGTYK